MAHLFSLPPHSKYERIEQSLKAKGYLNLQMMSKRCIILVFRDLFNLGFICVNSMLEICKHKKEELFIGQALCFVCGCSMHCEHVEETKRVSQNF